MNWQFLVGTLAIEKSSRLHYGTHQERVNVTRGTSKFEAVCLALVSTLFTTCTEGACRSTSQDAANASQRSAKVDARDWWAMTIAFNCAQEQCHGSNRQDVINAIQHLATVSVTDTFLVVVRHWEISKRT